MNNFIKFFNNFLLLNYKNGDLCSISYKHKTIILTTYGFRCKKDILPLIAEVREQTRKEEI